ncbi:hypothetical protein DIPPA_61183 [Diplonema papillatum]|nr:hypothetical protein DIPPA_61183 [Diplonema papillatum]
MIMDSGRLAAKEKRKVYVGNLPSTMTRDRLLGFFEQFGKVREVHILNRSGKGGRLSCFVTFSTADETLAAMKSLQQWHPDGQAQKATMKLADIKGFVPPEGANEVPNAPPYKLYVSNLPENSTPSYICEIFGEYGRIEDCLLLNNKGRGGRRSSFITFETREAAVAAQQSMSNELFDDNQRLTVRWANPAPNPVFTPLCPQSLPESNSYRQEAATAFLPVGISCSPVVPIAEG